MRKKKKRRGRAKLFFIILSLVAVYSVWNVSAKTPSSSVSCKDVFVAAGDSVWSIAVENADENTDIRKYVKQIEEYNNIKSSCVQAYTTIKVPDYQK